MDLKLMRVNASLDGIKSAQKRTRLTFLVSVVISLAVIITLWNAYFSWDRSFASAVRWNGAKGSFVPKTDTEPKESPVTQEAHRLIIAEWVKSQVITVPLLGIRVGISDAATLSGISLFIVAIWFSFSMRQENFLIGSLLRETKNDELDLRRFIYSSIKSQLVFTNINKSDQPLVDLHVKDEEKHVFFARKVDSFLFFLPPIGIALAITMDILSVFLVHSLFRYPHAPLFSLLNKSSEWISLVVIEIIAIILLTLTSVVCFRSLKYEQGTAKTLTKYANLIKDEEKEKKKENS